MMEITPVSEVLSAEDLHPPTINVLVPSIDNYTALLMQPPGYIEASAAGVRNRDRALARQQFSGFLAKAVQTNADLAVTPEYSMPWDVLVDAIQNGAKPQVGKLWVIGCESIGYAELGSVKERLSTFATVIHEPLPPATNRFFDPLAYIFLAPSANGTGPTKLVLLIQFKTHPMGDADHFEINALQRGTRVYQFGVAGRSIRLISLICSDVFDFLDAQASAIAIPMHDHHEMAPSPQGVTLAIYVLPRRFPRLVRQLLPLLPNPTEL
jgi:hypothetical protein